MEIKSQILVGVFSGLGGALFGGLVVVIAVYYRRRRNGPIRSTSHGVHYRKRSSVKRTSDAVNLNLNPRGSHDSAEYSPPRRKKASVLSDKNDIERKDRNSRSELSERSSREESSNLDSRIRRYSGTKGMKRINSDFTNNRSKSMNSNYSRPPNLRLQTAERMDINYSQPPRLWLKDADVTCVKDDKSRGESRNIAGIHIPRPSVRRHRNELFGRNGNNIHNNNNKNMLDRRHTCL